MKNHLNRSDFYFKGIGRVLAYYIYFILLMLIFRLFFIYYFGDIPHLQTNQADVIQSLFWGWKYDTLVVSYLIAPFCLSLILISFVKSKLLFSVFNFTLRIWFLLMGIFIPIILVADMGFYSFFQDHINILFFGLFEDDTQALIETIWTNYPVVWCSVLAIIYFTVVFKISRYLFPKLNLARSYFNPGAMKFIGMLSVSLLLLIGGLRGGYGQLVIAPKYSDFSESEFINQVAINGIIALEKTIKIRIENNRSDFSMTQAMGYGSDIHKAYSDFLGIDVSPTPRDQLVSLISRKTPFSKTLEEKKFHVIVLVMESFGGSWIKYNSSDFNFLGNLKNHFNDGFFFNNIISSENGTIGSLLTIATGIPPRPGKRYLSESKFLQLPLASSAHLPYKENGYESSFVYGGKLGWRDIGKYFKYQGFDNLIGENAISKNLNLSGHNGTEWGLYDELFFDYIFKKIEKSTHPQFIVALSTSNHPPFEVPSSYEPLPLEIPSELNRRILREKQLFLKRFKAFQYSNVKLSSFISKIKNSSLADNTIIVVTGDHNFWGFMNYNKSEVFEKYQVPLYFYLPSEFKIGEIDYDKVGSHEDIMSTLYNLTLSDTEYISFGEDLFSSEISFAFNSSISGFNDGVIYRDKSYVWKSKPFTGKTSDIQFKNLEKRIKSTMAVSDHFLEESFKKVNKKIR